MISEVDVQSSEIDAMPRRLPTDSTILNASEAPYRFRNLKISMLPRRLPTDFAILNRSYVQSMLYVNVAGDRRGVQPPSLVVSVILVTVLCYH